MVRTALSLLRFLSFHGRRVLSSGRNFLKLRGEKEEISTDGIELSRNDARVDINRVGSLKTANKLTSPTPRFSYREAFIPCLSAKEY